MARWWCAVLMSGFGQGAVAAEGATREAGEGKWQL